MRLSVLLPLLAACSAAPLHACVADIRQVDPSEEALSAWARMHGEASTHCQDVARAVWFSPAGPDSLAQVCRAALNANLACLVDYEDEGGSEAAVLTEYMQTQWVLVHETLHAIAQCETGSPDAAHRDHAFDGYRSTEHRPNQ
jgi:hypothetical protein